MVPGILRHSVELIRAPSFFTCIIDSRSGYGEPRKRSLRPFTTPLPCLSLNSHHLPKATQQQHCPTTPFTPFSTLLCSLSLHFLLIFFWNFSCLKVKNSRCDAVEAPFDMLRRRLFVCLGFDLLFVFFFSFFHWVHLHSLSSSAQLLKNRNETKGRRRRRVRSSGYY